MQQLLIKVGFYEGTGKKACAKMVGADYKRNRRARSARDKPIP